VWVKIVRFRTGGKGGSCAIYPFFGRFQSIGSDTHKKSSGSKELEIEKVHEEPVDKQPGGKGKKDNGGEREKTERTQALLFFFLDKKQLISSGSKKCGFPT